MMIKRTYQLTTAALVAICLWTCTQAIAQSPDASQATSQAASKTLSDHEAVLPIPAITSQPVDSAAPAPYPAASSSSSGWSPTHFEILGFVQWRNLSSNSGFSSTYCLPASGCVINTGSLSNNLPFSGSGVGPDFRFIWTPEKKILNATSKIWVDWGQIDRSRTRTITGEFTFLGVDYVVNSTLQAQLNNKLFSLGYAPRWGNDKFRIGPEFEYQRLNVNFVINNLTTGAPPPTHESLSVPNNIMVIGIDFDYMPVQQFDVFGRSGWIPCCGGGWHENETEFGAKYYIRRNFSILGGFRYYYLKRDFSAPANTVTVAGEPVVLGPFSGFIKFPGIGPFIGMSYRF
jgi:hypothetical protein